MIEAFGTLDDGRTVDRVCLAAHGLVANVLTWGAVVQDLRLANVPYALVLGFPDFKHYPKHSPSFGSIVGRVANRIRNGHARIDGQSYQFDRNVLGRHTLHGGSEGTGKQLWRIAAAGDDFATLTLTLPDGHMGFPGAMDVTATYRILPGPALEIAIDAESDAPTLCNFAHHSYFNLDGAGDGRSQEFQVHADHFLEIDEDLVPTGRIVPVDGTQFDFRSTRPILLGDAQYDHNLCLSRQRCACRPVATLKGAKTGVEMVIETTEPGLQLYDGVNIPARTQDLPGLNGKPYAAHAGIALEPQAWPDAPNQDWVDQVSLVPGDTYSQVTRFVFG
ncbi:galactose mutarotase [Hwanghaeella grinnelliae]|uniref:Aldose 1-epimerase n=1 Tax=Hwanghaeella grinnelliae TaxID=2500179 RepID=A0A3S2Y4D7_9PROT|nr:aldose epimerase family protein [Hwanghaeella grinnelliae]RVU38231.1 galactose mutarotase [Hwanghaeella grinnelliae]